MPKPPDEAAAATLALQVEQALDATLRLDDTREQEPYFSAVLETLEGQPALRPLAVRLFCEMIDAGRPVEDVLAYCMHSLRWPEIEQHAAHLDVPEDSEDWRRRHLAYQDILMAYRGDWMDRCLYERYEDGTGATGR